MPKHWVTAAVGLTGWLNAQHLGLDDLDQSLLDGWLADGPATRGRTIRPFLAWLQRNGRGGLRVPTGSAGTRVLALDDEQRLAVLRTLLHEDAIDARLRLAGCLVALYAQPAARIVRLTSADLQLTDAGAQIRLGRDMTALPAQLRGVAELLLALTPDHGWLFPGQKAGHPTHPTHLARRLRGLGVPVARARPSALAALAHRIPAAVLADLLGFDAHTVCNASGELKVDYARYIARRT
jgi:integrase